MRNERYTRYEVLDSWFFPSVTHQDGHIATAPSEVEDFYNELQDGWLKEQPRSREKPAVSLHKGNQNGEEGWIVETGIYIPPLKATQQI